MSKKLVLGLWCLVFLANPVVSQIKYPVFAKSLTNSDTINQISNQYLPVIGVWMWGDPELNGDGYKQPLEKAGKNSPFNLLIPFLRFPEIEVVDNIVHDQMKLAAEYAAENNIVLVPDLDIRTCRRAFMKKYPDELQQMLRIKEVPLSNMDSVEVIIPSIDLNDHYSGGRLPHHVAVSASVLGIYIYKKTPEGIDSETIKSVMSTSRFVLLSKDSIIVKIPPSNSKDELHAAVAVSFSHMYPDLFSPHIMEFQREILKQYADIKLAGVCKDEWGFPPYYPRFYRSGMNDFWYSKFRAQRYSEETGGRNLLNDCLLMAKGFKGKEAERQMAINVHMKMTRQRNIELEEDFYNTVKKVFGPDAAVTVHSTWWPYPDKCEYKKNGLDWWASKRDWAQTDEVVPYAVRTALCKKWGSAIWYNMYYKDDLATQIWSSALAGGRINYLSYFSLYKEDLMRAENRIRLLNYISKSPLDCRVAVIFGHASTMNWAGKYHDDVGMQLVDSLWKNGYPTDLIPTSEIENGSLKVDPEGFVTYGEQRYTAVVLYHPEYENKSTAQFFSKVNNEKTALFRIGDWTMDFKANPFNGASLLPKSMFVAGDINGTFKWVTELLEKQKVLPQTPATNVIDNTFFGLRDFNHSSCSPANTGFSRLIDGTVINIAATNDISGDPINLNFRINGFDVSVDAIGVVAVRLDKKGKLEALVASDLKSFKTKSFEIKLDERLDIALWKDSKGKWQGVIQGNKKPIPTALKKITANWIYLANPVPPKMN